MAEAEVLKRCEDLDWKALLGVYRDLLAETPDDLGWAALALRQHARAGKLPREIIPAVTLLLQEAEDWSVVANLGKTLAAFGRDAQLATVVVIEKARTIHIVDDETFWALDSLLHVLGYIGEPEATSRLVAELAGARPCPATRAGDLYRGTLPSDEREETWGYTLRRVPKMLALEDLGGWTKKRTPMQRMDVAERGGMSVLALRTRS